MKDLTGQLGRKVGCKSLAGMYVYVAHFMLFILHISLERKRQLQLTIPIAFLHSIK